MKEGDKFPSFELENQDGKIISLKDLKNWSVIYFYPKDNTPGCTIEAIAFTKFISDYKKLGVDIYGVSADSKESHCKFIEKQNLKIQLLVDTDHKLMDALSLWQKKKFMGREYMGVVRTTYLLNKNVIKFVWNEVSPLGHAKEVLEKAKELTAK